MSGLYASLNTTVKALAAQGRGIEIAGKNLSNINNTAYARQRVVFGDRGTFVTSNGAESLGLEALSVQQLRDSLVDRQVMREVALKSGFESEQSAYQRAQAGLGQSIDRSASAGSTTEAGDSGISASIDDFFNAFQSFAARPTDTGERQTLIQKSEILADRFQLADSRLAQVQADLGAEVASDVTEVNRLLSSIAELNGQIGRFEINAAGSAVDLRDQRQARLEELSAKMPIEVRDTASGQVQVFARDADGAEIPLVNLATVQGTVAFNGTQITAGSPATTVALGGGSIKGALTARDGAIQTLRNDLDQLARQLVTSVNAAYNPTGSTGNFFDPAGVAAGSINVVNTLTASTLKASDGGAAGENTIALAVAQLANREFSTAGGDHIDGTFAGHFSKTVSKIGQALAGANSRVEDQSNIERLIRSQRDSLSGVSLDEEMADLMKYQRAFQASSRVFNLIDELLDTVVNGLGR
ncbi:MAG: flagellar hook-associated protein FlgK [Verrucomicrobiota bacterium]